MQLRFKYLTLCTLSAMLVACGGSGYYDKDNDSTNSSGGGSNQVPGDGTNELPGDGRPETPGDGKPEIPGDGKPEIPDTSIPTTPIGPSTPIKPDTGIPLTPIGPSTPVKPDTGIPLTPIGPSTPVKPDTGIPIIPIEPSTPVKPPFISKYPEPKRDRLDSSILGFFDFDKLGLTRQIRNDLNGSFSAMVQFAQSHVVNPKNNESQFLPRLTTEKDALLLVTPTIEMGDPETLNAEIYLNNQLIRTVELKEPSRIASSDQSNADDRPRVQFSKRAWSTALSWSEVRPGLSIRIVDPVNNKTGDLRAEDIDFAAPGELVVQSIRLGLLTDPPKSTSHYMLLEPEKAGTDYFQTVPAARMIVSKYEDMKLNKVMVASGVIYDSVSASNGGTYSGDMRENTAKSTFSVGINLANWGVTSSSMQSQEQPQLTQSVVIHHARGKYINEEINDKGQSNNGEYSHGLSGGNGILTLYNSIGNEFSHEIGHHFGMSDYFGKNGTDRSLETHHADSGWGYIANRNRMRGNLDWNSGNRGFPESNIPSFLNLYAYGMNAMSSGYPSGSLSQYTYYTGYAAQQKIQPALDRDVWASDSATGYKKWNKETRMMEVSQPRVPAKSNNVWYNSANGNFLKPRLFSVPVYTIVGGYDPVNQLGLIYPAARGNWGNVFDLPQANTGGTAASCWLKVQSAGGVQNIALAPQRMNPNLDPNNLAVVNKFHVNLAQSDQPQVVDLYCKKENEVAVQLSSITIPVSVDAMSPYVSIGKEDGYSALKHVELPQLSQAFLQNQGKEVVNLSPTFRMFYDSYRLFKDEFSSDAQAEMVRYTQQQIKVYRLNRWVNTYYADLSSGNTEALEAFHAFVNEIGLNNDLPLANASMLTMPKMGNSCLKVEKLDTGALNVYMSGKNGCTGEPSTVWIHDAIGKIHSQQYPDLCLTNSRTLSSCNNDLQGQVWEVAVNADNTQQLRQGNSCLDLSGGYTPAADGRGAITMYGCGGGNNQKWTIVQQNQSLILAMSNGKNLPLISRLLTK
ncbi:M66 family metalloprotease [Acinetobacter silvestris]|uniref:Glycosyl transferase n=1 Tax=Acinetobacter silvestris TaxID=1977882 RepID=A0A1Y3CDF2_9GAMM|nr:M66 family metalloprotease [Acinetobacter silvestris]OTG65099.1 glycosyl transferase [Acinetobacter silvestris]